MDGYNSAPNSGNPHLISDVGGKFISVQPLTIKRNVSCGLPYTLLIRIRNFIYRHSFRVYWPNAITVSVEMMGFYSIFLIDVRHSTVNFDKNVSKIWNYLMICQLIET